jgi:hypothetical protein
MPGIFRRRIHDISEHIKKYNGLNPLYPSIPSSYLVLYASDMVTYNKEFKYREALKHIISPPCLSKTPTFGNRHNKGKYLLEYINKNSSYFPNLSEFLNKVPNFDKIPIKKIMDDMYSLSYKIPLYESLGVPHKHIQWNNNSIRNLNFIKRINKSSFLSNYYFIQVSMVHLGSGHANVIIINKIKNTFTIYEPHGGNSTRDINHPYSKIREKIIQEMTKLSFEYKEDKTNSGLQEKTPLKLQFNGGYCAHIARIHMLFMHLTRGYDDSYKFKYDEIHDKLISFYTSKKEKENSKLDLERYIGVQMNLSLLYVVESILTVYNRTIPDFIDSYKLRTDVFKKN